MCLVLITACAGFLVPSDWTNAEDTGIHHKCYVERTAQPTCVSASGGEATPNLQGSREGESRALARATRPCGSPRGRHPLAFLARQFFLGRNYFFLIFGSLNAVSIPPPILVTLTPQILPRRNCLLAQTIKLGSSVDRKTPSLVTAHRSLTCTFCLPGQFTSDFRGTKWPQGEASVDFTLS